MHVKLISPSDGFAQDISLPEAWGMIYQGMEFGRSATLHTLLAGHPVKVSGAWLWLSTHYRPEVIL